MKILVWGNKIARTGEFVETEDALVYPDITFYKHIIEGYQVFDVDLPSDFEYQKYIWENGFVLNPNWPPKAETQEEELQA